MVDIVVPIVDSSDVPINIRIVVFGVGGAGGNTVNTMINDSDKDYTGIEFVVANTDKQDLKQNSAPKKIQLGDNGFGAGANPEVGRRAALESEELIRTALDGVKILFIAAGMGGGTGTGAAPVIARIARELGILTVAVVTLPFNFEGGRRRRVAKEGLQELEEYVDTIVVLSNQKLTSDVGIKAVIDGYKYVDSILINAVTSISDVITKMGYINIDFADVKEVLSDKGHALMGTGVGCGPTRVEDAIKEALRSPLQESSTFDDATHILIHILADKTFSFDEIDRLETSEEVLALSRSSADREATSVFFGHTMTKEETDEVRITVIATGFTNKDRLPQTAALVRETAPNKATQVPVRGAAPLHSTSHLRGRTVLPAESTVIATHTPPPASFGAGHSPSMVHQRKTFTGGHRAVAEHAAPVSTQETGRNTPTGAQFLRNTAGNQPRRPVHHRSDASMADTPSSASTTGASPTEEFGTPSFLRRTRRHSATSSDHPTSTQTASRRRRLYSDDNEDDQ